MLFGLIKTVCAVDVIGTNVFVGAMIADKNGLNVNVVMNLHEKNTKSG